MLIDNEKFIGLLIENSGIEKEKVEKYLVEIVSDIKTVFDEDEGYEIEGFGIFSKLGANILFIPAEELQTEINYKYVGMEPIELPGGSSEEETLETEDDDVEENPIQGILDGGLTEEPDEYEDPFAELLSETETEDEELEDDDIEAAVEDEIEQEELDDIFNDTSDDEEETLDELSDDVIEESNDGDTETEDTEEASEEAPGPDKWGINAHKEDDQEDAFSGLLGEAAAESELIDEDDIFASDEEVEAEEEKSEEDIEEEIDFSALEDDITEDEDFDDPFEDLEEEREEEEDFVPVVTNVSSDITSEESVMDNDTEDTEKDAKKKSKYPKSPRGKKQNTPVFLYMILGLVILAGTGYILAYFGVVNIEGITPDKNKAQVAQVTTPVNPSQSEVPQTTLPEAEEPTNTIPEPANNGSDNSSPSSTESENTSNQVGEAIENTTEQSDQSAVKQSDNDFAPLIADEKAPGDGGIITPVNIQADAEPYGLKGTATETGNNGYTIVLYTLSRKTGADAQFEILSKAGYRVITKQMPSETYGVLYRVSIGQFKSLADAAIAAEKVDPDILGNYIITKI